MERPENKGQHRIRTPQLVDFRIDLVEALRSSVVVVRLQIGLGIVALKI